MPLGVSIAVGGAVDDSLADATSVEVHERMGRPTAYRIRFEVEAGSADFDRLTDDRLAAGSVLSVLVPGVGGNECLVKGPVVAQRIHLEHGGAGSYLEVRGADTAIVMDRRARSRVWADVTDSGAVTSVVTARDYGFVPDVASTAAGHFEAKHALVQRESDLSFVRRLARRNGFQFWISANGAGIETAHFKKLPLDATPSVTLAINRDTPTLETLDLTWDVERPTSVEGSQLDLNSLQPLDGATASSTLASLGKEDLAAITGDTRSVFLSAPVDDAGDLRARSAGVLVESTLFIRATTESTRERLGAPVRAFTVAELTGAGSRHSGRYFVVGVRHTIDAAEHRMELELLRNAWGG